MSTPSRFLTVVIQLPDDQQQRVTIVQSLPLFGPYHGGEITGMYAGDAISENEILEGYISAREVKSIRLAVNDTTKQATLEA